MAKRAKLSAFGAAAGLGLLGLIWYSAFHVGFVAHADQSVLRGFVDLHRPRVDRLAQFIAGLCSPSPYVYLAAVPVLIALARRRPRVAIALGLVILGANVTTQLLKPLLAEQRAVFPPPASGQLVVLPASWPSGHATAAMSLVLCMVIAVAPRLRPAVAALGAAFAVAVCYSFLTLGWHYPSDVLGGFLVAATWTLGGVAMLSATAMRSERAMAAVTDQHSPRPSVAGTLGPPAMALAAALVLVLAVVLARPAGVVSYARAHETFIVGAAAIAALGLALATGLALAIRR
jgi:membrane-associated phospholipid phosphatase